MTIGKWKPTFLLWSKWMQPDGQTRAVLTISISVRRAAWWPIRVEPYRRQAPSRWHRPAVYRRGDIVWAWVGLSVVLDWLATMMERFAHGAVSPEPWSSKHREGELIECPWWISRLRWWS